jgi:hypothetical protein
MNKLKIVKIAVDYVIRSENYSQTFFNIHNQQCVIKKKSVFRACGEGQLNVEKNFGVLHVSDHEGTSFF